MSASPETLSPTGSNTTLAHYQTVRGQRLGAAASTKAAAPITRCAEYSVVRELTHSLYRCAPRHRCRVSSCTLTQPRAHVGKCLRAPDPHPLVVPLQQVGQMLDRRLVVDATLLELASLLRGVRPSRLALRGEVRWLPRARTDQPTRQVVKRKHMSVSSASVP